MELLQGLALESFIENFYEDKQSAAELKEIIQKYNNDNFEKVKTRLQKPTVLAGMNVENPEEVESTNGNSFKSVNFSFLYLLIIFLLPTKHVSKFFKGLQACTIRFT